MGGDYAAFSTLCQRHSASLMGTIYRITRNREDAEDALQDAFLRAFVHLQSFDGRAQFSTWLTRIGVNSALMLLRKRKRRAEITIDSGGQDEDRFCMWEIPDVADDPERHLLKDEMAEWLSREIGDLDHSLRTALEIWVAQGSSTKEGARRLNISTAAFKSRVTRAKAALREEFVVTNRKRSTQNPRPVSGRPRQRIPALAEENRSPAPQRRRAVPRPSRDTRRRAATGLFPGDPNLSRAVPAGIC